MTSYHCCLATKKSRRYKHFKRYQSALRGYIVRSDFMENTMQGVYLKSVSLALNKNLLRIEHGGLGVKRDALFKEL